MYQTMKIESLSKMIPFFDFSAVEKISVDAVKHNFIAMKLDHMKHVVLFDTQVCFILYAVFLIVYHLLSLSLSLSFSHLHVPLLSSISELLILLPNSSCTASHPVWKEYIVLAPWLFACIDSF